MVKADDARLRARHGREGERRPRAHLVKVRREQLVHWVGFREGAVRCKRDDLDDEVRQRQVSAKLMRSHVSTAHCHLCEAPLRRVVRVSGYGSRCPLRSLVHKNCHRVESARRRQLKRGDRGWNIII
jgi:hypothetical protein